MATRLSNQMVHWLAYTSVGPSTVRGQRTSGLVDNLRQSLTSVNLFRIAHCRAAEFESELDSETRKIMRRMPSKARHWGLARKVLNIFLRNAAYNWLLRAEFRMERVEARLELPLDSITVTHLRRNTPRGSLPRWPGVKHLTADESVRFQVRAAEIAADLGTLRVHLDAAIWPIR